MTLFSCWIFISYIGNNGRLDAMKHESGRFAISRMQTEVNTCLCVSPIKILNVSSGNQVHQINAKKGIMMCFKQWGIHSTSCQVYTKKSLIGFHVNFHELVFSENDYFLTYSTHSSLLIFLRRYYDFNAHVI